LPPPGGAADWWASSSSTWWLGILLAYFSNYAVGLSLQGSANEWRWKLGISAAPAALFFLMLVQIPRSPRWLARKGRTQEARTALEGIGEENIDSELDAMNAAFQLAKQQGQERLFSARNRLPLFLAISIAMFNQLVGINAILYYLNDIFARAGFSKVSSDL
jgi:SP family arabinose:H+ symporter-like MFS transporter